MNTVNRNSLLFTIATEFWEDDSTDSQSSSSNSSAEDDNMLLDMILNIEEQECISAVLMIAETRGEQPKIETMCYVERIIPGYNEQVFKQHFRMFPETFEDVLRLVGPSLNANTVFPGGRQPIEPKKQLFVALWFMATPDSYRSICVKFGIGKATAFRALRRVTYALHCIAPKIIKWPGNQVNSVMEVFEQKAGFPNVIGAIDGCHIKIRKPKVDPISYINRKGFYSINLQAVCDSRRLFTHCFVGYPGAVHDARVFRNSPVADFMNQPQNYFPNNSHLLGDAAYSLHTHCMVPFRNNGHLSQRQKNFNYCLSATRVTIEHAFALLKGRFRILLDCLPLWDIRKIPEFIIACCVLHNVCILKNDLIEYVFVPGEQEQDVVHPHHLVNNVGHGKRNSIMNELRMRN